MSVSGNGNNNSKDTNNTNLPSGTEEVSLRSKVNTVSKPKSPKWLLVTGVAFSLVSIYFVCHIAYWFYSNSQAEAIVYSMGSEGDTDEIVEETYHDKLPYLDIDFEPLKERNEEIVAWLRLGVIDLDVPITQTTDNDFYLTHDADKNPNKLGWIFADTRSNIEHMGMNTVLYGHNAMNSQMFGGLKGLMEATEDNKEEYELIQFTTETKQLVYEITSVYITDYDDWEYVAQSFPNEDSKRAFINRMQDRNIIKAFHRDDLSVHDDFLTFSTCHGPAGTTKRLVVHARLIGSK